jgi:hypothetical protein
MKQVVQSPAILYHFYQFFALRQDPAAERRTYGPGLHFNTSIRFRPLVFAWYSA